VDIRLRKNGYVVFMQCKHWKARFVGVKVVRELYGVMAAKNVKHGIVFMYGDFTPDVKEFAKGKAIGLMDESYLTHLIAGAQQSGSNMVSQEIVDLPCKKMVSIYPTEEIQPCRPALRRRQVDAMIASTADRL